MPVRQQRTKGHRVTSLPQPPASPTPTDELFIAVVRNDVLALSLALKAGGNPGAILSNGMTPLHVALDRAGTFSVAREFADRGVPESLRARVQRPPKPGAEDLLLVVRALLAAGASVSKPDKSGETPLHCAATFPVREVVAELLAAGADIRAQDSNGMTPLHLLAMFSDDADAAEALIAAGADVNAVDRLGHRPIDYTGEWQDRTQVPAALIRAGASTAGIDKSWRRRIAKTMLKRSGDQGIV